MALRIPINVHVHVDNAFARQLEMIIETLTSLVQLGEQQMSAFDGLKADVAALRTVEGGVRTLILGMAQKIDDLGDAPSAEEIAALSAEVRAQATELAAAVAVGTAAGDEPDPDEDDPDVPE